MPSAIIRQLSGGERNLGCVARQETWLVTTTSVRIGEMADAAHILEEALTLDPDDRARVARRLILSLEPETAAVRYARKHERLRAALEGGERSGIAEDSSLGGVIADFRNGERSVAP